MVAPPGPNRQCGASGRRGGLLDKRRQWWRRRNERFNHDARRADGNRPTGLKRVEDRRHKVGVELFAIGSVRDVEIDRLGERRAAWWPRSRGVRRGAGRAGPARSRHIRGAHSYRAGLPRPWHRGHKPSDQGPGQAPRAARRRPPARPPPAKRSRAPPVPAVGRGGRWRKRHAADAQFGEALPAALGHGAGRVHQRGDVQQAERLERQGVEQIVDEHDLTATAARARTARSRP